jgi:hypothetical protein
VPDIGRGGAAPPFDGIDVESADGAHSHSIVAGGFDETSYTTRLMARTSLMTRDEILARSSCGSLAQSPVMPSVDSTARMAQVAS